MPPYQYDSDVGIQDLKEDWRMSEEDIATVVAWVGQRSARRRSCGHASAGGVARSGRVPSRGPVRSSRTSS